MSVMNEKKEWKYCVVGNIVKERIDENGVLRYGTAAFKGGAKVYLCGKEYDFSRDSIDALGLSRGRRLQVIWTPRDQIENLRLQKVYRPGVLYIMNDDEFARYWWGDTDADKRDAEGFIRRWNWHKEHDRPE